MEIWFELFAGTLGKLWRQNRRKLKPGVRGAFAQLLLEVRAELLPTTSPDAQPHIGRVKLDMRGVTELLNHTTNRKDPSTQDAGDLVGTWAPITDQTACVDDNRQLEVRTLRKDIGDLEAEISRITLTHQSQMLNLRRKLEDSVDVMQHGMTSLTEQVATQANCLSKAFRVNRVIPNGHPP